MGKMNELAIEKGLDLHKSFVSRKQYHFPRDIFCETFCKVFNDKQSDILWHLCFVATYTENFLLTMHEEETYLIHLESGVIVNWYKHLGRTNTCNVDSFTLRDLEHFFLLLKEDLKDEFEATVLRV